MDIEYCVYDVTPDVSIDFVSFTTEESEGIKELLCNFFISDFKRYEKFLFTVHLFTLEVKSHPSQYNMLFVGAKCAKCP